MYSRTQSLLSSLVLKDSGSSRTSPSRLPRMLVENQPLSPSSRAFKPGARMVFISVWPVLKSLPQMGTPFSRASSRWPGCPRSGSARRWRRGRLIEGRRRRRSCSGRWTGGSPSWPFRRIRSSRERALASRKISVEAHQIMTRRSSLFSFLKFRISSMRRLGVVLLRRGLFDVSPCRFFTYCLVEDGRPGLDGLQLPSGPGRDARGSGRPPLRRFVSVVGEDIPAAEHEIVETGQSTKSLIRGVLLSVRFPRRIVPIWVREPMGLARPFRMDMTPAMKVVATAPRPTVITPSFPAGF